MVRSSREHDHSDLASYDGVFKIQNCRLAPRDNRCIVSYSLQGPPSGAAREFHVHHAAVCGFTEPVMYAVLHHIAS